MGSDNEYAICPFCKAHHGDCWEWVTERPQETECGECGKTFVVYAHYSVTYYTYAQGIAAGTAETPQGVPCEAQEPDPEGDAP